MKSHASQQIQKTVLLPQRLAEAIGLERCAVPSFRVEWATDLRRLIISLLREGTNTLYDLLIFLYPPEMEGIHRLLEGLPRDTVNCGLILLGASDEQMKALGGLKLLLDIRPGEILPGEYEYLVNRAFSQLSLARDSRLRQHQQELQLLDTKNDQETLISIGKSLTLEKDPDKLLRSILFQSKKITGADAGSIFLVEIGAQGEKLLRFRFSHTFSKELDYEEFTMPCDTRSIAGYVAVTGNVLNIPDVYHLGEDAPVSFNDSFDRSHGYQTRSMLVVPMRNHIDEIIGVIQLINSKESLGDEGHYSGNEAYEVLLAEPSDFENRVVPFDERYESLMESIAGQAAVALENSRMIEQIEHQFEEFVKASVAAIDSRDPATSGHSLRVAELSLSLARGINDCSQGRWSELFFTEAQLKELELAALLHDFGKVYIDDSIFQKAKKLFPRDFDYLKMRLSFLLRSLEVQTGDESRREILAGEVKSLMVRVSHLNEPKVMIDDPDREVAEILAAQKALLAYDLDGDPIPVLTAEEADNLRIKRGTLNAQERKIIESHVEHTYSFVSKIPWPDEFAQIPEIAHQHHEMLNGSGYPLGLQGDAILPQARIMAIADIFDALSASDRPYKKAVPLDKVVLILQDEADRGRLDPEMTKLFLDQKLYNVVLEKAVHG